MCTSWFLHALESIPAKLTLFSGFGPHRSVARDAPRALGGGGRGTVASGRCTLQTAAKVVRGLLGTGPPDPTLESASPSPPQGSIWHRDRVKSGNRCRIDAKLTTEKGRARRIRGWGPSLRGSVPNEPLATKAGTGTDKGTRKLSFMTTSIV